MECGFVVFPEQIRITEPVMFRGAKLFSQNVRFFLTEPRRFPAAAGLPRPGGRLGSTQGLELSPWSVFPHGSGRYPNRRGAGAAACRHQGRVAVQGLAERLSFF